MTILSLNVTPDMSVSVDEPQYIKNHQIPKPLHDVVVTLLSVNFTSKIDGITTNNGPAYIDFDWFNRSSIQWTAAQDDTPIPRGIITTHQFTSYDDVPISAQYHSGTTSQVFNSVLGRHDIPQNFQSRVTLHPSSTWEDFSIQIIFDIQ